MALICAIVPQKLTLKLSSYLSINTANSCVKRRERSVLVVYHKEDAIDCNQKICHTIDALVSCTFFISNLVACIF